jgi:myosin-1
MIDKATWPHVRDLPRDAVQTILANVGLKSGSDFQLGTSKVFIRAPQSIFILEELRERRLHEIALQIQRTYKAWKARKFFLELREKALGLYQGKKLRRKVSAKLYYVGDYVQDTGNKEIKALLSKSNDKKVIFFDLIEKINKRWVSQPRYLILTDKNVHILKQASFIGKYDVRHSFSLDKVSGVTLSPLADNFCVLHVSGDFDYVLVFERKTEFVTALNDALTAKGQKLTMYFALFSFILMCL